MQKRKPNLINKAFNQYFWASILMVAATQIANIVDATIVGNLLGAGALAAVNLSKPLIQAFFAISCLYVFSSAMLSGMAIGKGDRGAANKLFTFTLSLSLVIGTLVTVVGLVGFGPISNVICQSEALRPLSDAFLRVTLISAVPQLMMYSINQFVTMDGDPKRVSRAVIVGNVFNILLDIVFIKFCGWGIAGAAAATCIMYIVCILMVLPHFHNKGSLRLCKTRWAEVEIRRVLSIGLPLFFSTALISVQYIGNNYVCGHYLGDNGLIALAVCMQLFAFSMIILTGTLRTVQPVGAILKGMDDSQGMLMLLKRAYTFLTISFAVFTAVLVLFPAQIGILLGVTTEDAMQVVKTALPLFSLNIVFQGLLCNLLPVYQFYDHKYLALFLSIGQPLFPMFGFWLLKGGWIGFFLGQLAVATVLLIGTAILRGKDKTLSPVFLVPRTPEKEIYDVTIETNLEALQESEHALREFLLSRGLDMETANRYVLCAEELLKNIIQHGHANCVDIRATDSIISIHDDGKPFNPLEYCDESEGLGLKIVHGIDIAMKYNYCFEQNMVTIVVNC